MTKAYLRNIKNIYYSYKTYSAKLQFLKLRRPNFPEYVSEGMIKIILNNSIDKTSKKCKNGDLISDIEGRQECKCFTSNAPISFGPSQKWSVLYILDGRKWLVDSFILYRIDMSSKDFNKINISKNETYKDLCLQKRRPKIKWNSLKPQLKKCNIIFNGSIEKISINK